MIRIIHSNYDSLEAKEIVAELQEYYTKVFGLTDGSVRSDDELKAPYGDFILAIMDTDDTPGVNSVVVGCAGYKLHTENRAELKRMYVKPGVRGKSIARTMLYYLETAVHDKGVTTMILETHPRLTGAIEFYQLMGYQPSERFGYYSHNPRTVHLKFDLPRVN